MNEETLRFECLRIALSIFGEERTIEMAEVIRLAEALFHYVRNGKQ